MSLHKLISHHLTAPPLSPAGVVPESPRQVEEAKEDEWRVPKSRGALAVSQPAPVRVRGCGRGGSSRGARLRVGRERRRRELRAPTLGATRRHAADGTPRPGAQQAAALGTSDLNARNRTGDYQN